MSRYIVSWKIGGEAGFGIKSSGLMFSQMCTRAGYEVFGYVEYPSLIRGGHNIYQVTVSENPVSSTAENVDILVALNQEAIDRHLIELNHGAVIIYDPDTTNFPQSSKRVKEYNIKSVAVPLTKMATEAKGQQVMRNTVALGASAALLSLPFSLVTMVIKKTLSRKASLLSANIKAAELGYTHFGEQYNDIDFKVQLKKRKVEERMLLTGNDAISLGALAAGMQMYVAYPMTPSTPILHYLASLARSQRVIVKHAEDEISVINMALGASHVGARTMLGTSGGGFSLMTEGLGLTGITETPLVIVEVQRPGPATGLPTWTEQGDLRFLMHAAQGEFPRIIVTPGDTDECFYLTAQAFNWADKYQTPVFVVSDKFLSESHRSTPIYDQSKITINRHQAVMSAQQLKRQKDYKRYKITANGISPRSVPGTPGGVYLANSDEHDEYGYSNEESANRVSQVVKRANKFKLAAEKINGVVVYGNPKAKITVIGWGSVKGPVLDAIAWLPARKQKKIRFVHLNVVWPFPSKKIYDLLRNSKTALLIENNSTAQLGNLIRQQTGIAIPHKYLKYDGRPFYPIDIKERLMHL